jgi:hypothetical protein
MKQQAAPAPSRGRPVPSDAFALAFVRSAHMLAIRRAARDAHRVVCDRDAVGCTICCRHAAAIADAKWALNHPPDPT